MTDVDDDDNSPKRFRSPPYPFIPLDKAIERARQLQPLAHHHPVPAKVLAEAWSFGIKSSGLAQTAAALIQHGLLEDSGAGETRRYQLTRDALRLIQDTDPHSSKRRELLLKAALAPKIYSELWRRFQGGDVSDSVLRTYLMFDRLGEDGASYSQKAADALIAQYKSTIAYADLSTEPVPDSYSDKVQEVKKAGGLEPPTPLVQLGGPDLNRAVRGTKRPGTMEDVFSLKEGDVVLQWPQHLSRESYEDLEAWAQIILRKIKRSISEGARSDES